MNPSALEKAKSLYDYALGQGSQVSTFELAVSDTEAFELLDWFVEQNPGNELLEFDVSDAKRKGNPWEVMNNFVLMGLKVVPRMTLH